MSDRKRRVITPFEKAYVINGNGAAEQGGYSYKKETDAKTGEEKRVKTSDKIKPVQGTLTNVSYTPDVDGGGVYERPITQGPAAPKGEEPKSETAIYGGGTAREGVQSDVKSGEARANEYGGVDIYKERNENGTDDEYRLRSNNKKGVSSVDLKGAKAGKAWQEKQNEKEKELNDIEKKQEEIKKEKDQLYKDEHRERVQTYNNRQITKEHKEDERNHRIDEIKKQTILEKIKNTKEYELLSNFKKDPHKAYEEYCKNNPENKTSEEEWTKVAEAKLKNAFNARYDTIGKDLENDQSYRDKIDAFNKQFEEEYASLEAIDKPQEDENEATAEDTAAEEEQTRSISHTSEEGRVIRLAQYDPEIKKMYEDYVSNEGTDGSARMSFDDFVTSLMRSPASPSVINKLKELSKSGQVNYTLNSVLSDVIKDDKYLQSEFEKYSAQAKSALNPYGGVKSYDEFIKMAKNDPRYKEYFDGLQTKAQDEFNKRNAEVFAANGGRVEGGGVKDGTVEGGVKSGEVEGGAVKGDGLDEAASTLGMSKGTLSNTINNLYKTWGGGIIDTIGSISGLVNATMDIITRASAVTPSMTGLNEANAAVDELNMNGQLATQFANDIEQAIQNLSNARQQKKAEEVIRTTGTILENALRLVNPSARSVNDLDRHELAAYSVIAGNSLAPLANAIQVVGGKSVAGRYLNDYVQSVYGLVKSRSTEQYDQAAARMGEIRNNMHNIKDKYVRKLDKEYDKMVKVAQDEHTRLMTKPVGSTEWVIGKLLEISNSVHGKGANGVGDGTFGELFDNKFFRAKDITDPVTGEVRKEYTPTTDTMKDAVNYILNAASYGGVSILTPHEENVILDVLSSKWGAPTKDRLQWIFDAKANAIAGNIGYAQKDMLAMAGATGRNNYERNNANGVPLDAGQASKTLEKALGYAVGYEQKLNSLGVYGNAMFTINPTDSADVKKYKNLYMMTLNMMDACRLVTDFDRFKKAIDVTDFRFQKDPTNNYIRVVDRAGNVVLDNLGVPKEYIERMGPDFKNEALRWMYSSLLNDLKDHNRIYELDESYLPTIAGVQYLPFSSQPTDQYYSAVAMVSQMMQLKGVPAGDVLSTLSHEYKDQSFVPSKQNNAVGAAGAAVAGAVAAGGGGGSSAATVAAIQQAAQDIKNAIDTGRLAGHADTNAILTALKSIGTTDKSIETILGNIDLFNVNDLLPSLKDIIKQTKGIKGDTRKINAAVKQVHAALKAMPKGGKGGSGLTAKDIDKVINSNTLLKDSLTALKEAAKSDKEIAAAIDSVINKVDNSIKTTILNPPAGGGGRGTYIPPAKRTAVDPNIRAAIINKEPAMTVVARLGKMEDSSWNADEASFNRRFSDLMAVYDYAKASELSVCPYIANMISKAIIYRCFGMPTRSTSAAGGGGMALTWERYGGLTPLIDLSPGASALDSYGRRHSARRFQALSKYAAAVLDNSYRAPDIMRRGAYDSGTNHTDLFDSRHIGQFLKIVTSEVEGGGYT